MCRPSKLYRSSFCALAIAVSVLAASGQDRTDPYTPSPSSVSGTVALNAARPRSSSGSEDVDRSTAYSATQIYRIGVGDILYINIVNSANGKGFYAVRNDGTIDYALAGENIVAAGRTTDALQRALASTITLYPNPKVEVKVREFASHRVSLSGLVSNGGVRYIQREAIPLFVICADAEVNAKATKVVIRDGRTNAVNTYDLHDRNTANIVVNSGDDIEFLGS